MLKKSYCLLLALILVFSISCISASDVNQTADALEIDEMADIQEANYENTLSNESSEPTINESEYLEIKTNIDNYGTLYANVTFDENITGNITFSVSYSENEIFNETVPIENRTAVLSEYKITTSGLYIITAKYSGESNFTGQINPYSTMITKSSPDLEIISKIIDDMGNIQVNISINRNAAGNITLSFNSSEVTVPIVNGTAILEKYSLKKGNYTLTAYYDGDRSFFKASANDTLEVSKSIIPLNLTSQISENGLLSVNVKLDENATGTVNVYITDANQSDVLNQDMTIENGTVSFKAVEVENNTYFITATYLGDENYYYAESTANITTTKKHPNLVITDLYVTDEGYVVIELLIHGNATGNITLKFNEIEVTLPLENVTALLKNYTLEKKFYNVSAIYKGDENFFAATENDTLNVTKTKEEIFITPEITEDGLLNVNITSCENATGNITIKITDISGTEIYKKESQINATISTEPVRVENNTYIITAQYAGDENYFKTNAAANITTTKKHSNLKIENIEVDEQGNININITIDENATGNITLNFNETAVTLPITNGTAKFENYKLEKGNYTLKATYENENYFKATVNDTINITKNNAQISITPEITDLGYLNVNVTITENTTGNITLTVTDISGTEIYSQNFTANDTITTDAIKAENNTYTITATYTGDENHYKTNAVANITTTKKHSNLKIENIEVDEQGNININITIDENATGNITLNFNETQTTIETANGTAKLENYKLEKGNYTLTATYENENYFKATANDTINITKINSNLEIIVETGDFGISNITVHIDENATGNITVLIENNSTTILEVIRNIDNASVILNNVTLPAGDYTVTANYDGDYSYFKNSESVDLKIKAIPTLSAEAIVNDNLISIITSITNSTTGNVTYTFIRNNITVYETTVEVHEGDASFKEKTVFQKGNYTVVISYPGDENFYTANMTVNATVDKNTPAIDIAVYTDDYGMTTITATTNDAISGNITLEVLDTKSNSTCTVKLDKGNYTVTASYDGDDNYYATAVGMNFTISRQFPQLDASAESKYNVAVVNATINDNATGIIRFTIGENADVEIVNGTATFEKQLGKGEYEIFIEYQGDDNYFMANTTRNVTIAKNTPEITGSVKITGKTAEITVKIENATGIVSVNGVNATLINGSVSIIGNYPSGNNKVTVRYFGDDNNFNATKDLSFYIKKDTSIRAGAINIVYLNNGRLTVRLNESISNVYVQVILNGKTYKGLVTNGTAVISVSGKMMPKTYVATLKFSGNTLYNGCTGKVNVVIKKANTKIIASKRTYKVNVKTKSYAIILRNYKNYALKKVTVTLKVNGKTFRAVTNNYGKAIFKITNLKKKANFIALIKYSGNRYYNAVSKKVILTVKR